jgi:2,3-bisphosphoglycerate-independent phosphoglycerate mutase
MSDYPLAEKGGKTPLELSHTPFMDSIAQRGTLGIVKTIPDGIPPGSDVANLSVLGYNPALYYTGRAPLEAASIGVELSSDDTAFRCNLVTLGGSGDHLFMDDYSAGHISTVEAHAVINALKHQLDELDSTFYTGVSYRHLLVWKGGEHRMETTPPHDITGREIAPYLPRGPGSEKLIDLMHRARPILQGLPFNTQKIASGMKPANAIWLWGQGKSLHIPTFKEKYNLSGAVISAVDLVKGLGMCAGLHPITVPGATGYLDTNYEGKAHAALNALETVDFVYLHVEAPDEASHKGSLEDKIQAIEHFDRRVVKLILEGLQQKFSDYRVLVLPDHPTPLSIKTHAADPVPFALVASREKELAPQARRRFTEKDASESGLVIDKGWELMDRFITT